MGQASSSRPRGTTRWPYSSMSASLPGSSTRAGIFQALLDDDGAADLDVLATQLTAALDGPLLLYLSSETLSQAAPQVSERLGQGWEDLVRRVCRPLSSDSDRARGSVSRVWTAPTAGIRVGAGERM